MRGSGTCAHAPVTHGYLPLPLPHHTPRQAAGSEAALASANARLSALQRQLAVTTAEKQELAARLAAADMEAAGSAEVC